MTFAEVTLGKAMQNNRSLKRLGKIDEVINWDRVNGILMSHYKADRKMSDLRKSDKMIRNKPKYEQFKGLTW